MTTMTPSNLKEAIEKLTAYAEITSWASDEHGRLFIGKERLDELSADLRTLIADHGRLDAGWQAANTRALECGLRPSALEGALRLVLPLAKGYAPEGQTAEARRTCNSWIEAAEEALASLASTVPVCVLCGAKNTDPRPWDPKEPVCPDCQDRRKEASTVPVQEEGKAHRWGEEAPPPGSFANGTRRNPFGAGRSALSKDEGEGA